ncbi:MAG: hypothetical protein BWK80_54265 [Desulfobacteraceae bacterium IS3]|nr:MAG: hypothetical protein BWK80_54265 [Desulfobacteraceae bacterium IS3]
MPTKKNLKLLATAWNSLLESEREALDISESDLSALSSWIEDCHGSFEEIYLSLLERIRSSSPTDYESAHDSVVEIYWQLDHIKNHITAAEKGFTELMRVLSAKLGD